MPLTVPDGALTKLNWVLAHLKPLVDAIEIAAAAAKSRADAAFALAEGRYAKPAGGIPAADLAPGVATAKGAVEYYWRSTLTPPQFVLGPGQFEDGVSPQWGVGGPAGAWEASSVRDAERPSRESPV